MEGTDEGRWKGKMEEGEREGKGGNEDQRRIGRRRKQSHGSGLGGGRMVGCW